MNEQKRIKTWKKNITTDKLENLKTRTDSGRKNALFLIEDINLRKKQRGGYIEDEIPERVILNTIPNKSPADEKEE